MTDGARNDGGAPGPDVRTADVLQPGAPYQQSAPQVWPQLGELARPRPKTVVKADLLPALSVLSTVSLGGLVVGWLWSRLAPGLKVIVASDGTTVPLPLESYHRFDDLAVFAMLCFGAGLLTAAVVWTMRGRRGPVVLVAAVLGGALGAWLASQVGVSWAEARFAVPTGLQLGDQFTVAPRLESLWGVVGWPLLAALGYGVLAAWNGRDDLGRRLG